MKIPHRFGNFVCFLAITISFGCQDEGRRNEVQLFVYGDTTQLVAKAEILNSFLSEKPMQLAQTKLDSTGHCAVRFDLNSPSFVYFKLGGMGGPVYVEPGYSLKLSVNHKGEFDFSGHGADPNVLLTQAISTVKSYERRNGNFYWYLTPDRFSLLIDSLENDIVELHSSDWQISSHLNEVLLATSQARILLMKLNYLGSNSFSGREPDLPRNLRNLKVPFKDELLDYHSAEYRLLLQFFLQLEIYPSTQEWDSSRVDVQNQMAAFTQSKIKQKKASRGVEEYLIAQNIDYWMAQQGLITCIDSLFSQFSKLYPTSPYLAMLKDRREKWISISPGKQAPGFNAFTSDGKPFLISDLTGKMIYMDIWATWCGPCFKDFPYAIEVQQDFVKNNKLVFLYVSVDKDTLAWKQMLKSKNVPPGLQVICSDGSVLSSYVVQGIPRTVMIDDSGKIISGIAPRPSSSNIRRFLKDLL